MSNSPSENTTKCLIGQNEIFLLAENSANASNASNKAKPSDDAKVWWIILSNYLLKAFKMPNGPNRAEKRSASDDVDLIAKKTKIETPILEKEVSMPSAANIASAQFVSAATMMAPVPDITDEELLEFTREFERKHGIHWFAVR